MGGGIFLIQKNFASWIGGEKINVGPQMETVFVCGIWSQKVTK